LRILVYHDGTDVPRKHFSLAGGQFLLNNTVLLARVISAVFALIFTLGARSHQWKPFFIEETAGSD